MKLKLLLAMVALTSFFSNSNGQTQPSDTNYRKFFVGSSLFVLANLVPYDNPPEFVQLNFGYRITPKDVVSLELITWRYASPLGIPYGDSYEAPEEKYPGYVRDVGIALVYQRFLWKNLYGAIHALNAMEQYVDEENVKIQKGYMLFMTYRLGYHIPLFKNRMFIEPSIAITHWPVRTNVPESFAAKDQAWPNYFLFEPGFHFGVKF